MVLTRAVLQSVVDAEAAKWETRTADEVLALLSSNRRYSYQLEVAASGVSFDLELLGGRDEAVDLLLQAQPMDESDIAAVSVPRSRSGGGWSEEELGIASTYFWIDR